MLRSTFLLFAAVALGAMGVLASTTDMPVFDASTTNLAKVAAELPRLRLENVNLPNKGTGNLLLERFNVFTPDAVIYNGDQAVLPAVTNAAYFRGKLEDDANSIAVLVAHASGVLRGVVRASDGTHYVLDSDDDDDDDDAPADPNHVHTNSTGMARPRLMDGSEAPSDPLPTSMAATPTRLNTIAKLTAIIRTRSTSRSSMTGQMARTTTPRRTLTQLTKKLTKMTLTSQSAVSCRTGTRCACMLKRTSSCARCFARTRR